MTGMRYDRNSSRDMSRYRFDPADGPVHVPCAVCRTRVPADGVHAVRATAERGVRTRLGYSGQTWLCAGCVAEYGPTLTLDLAEALRATTWITPGQEPAVDTTGLPEGSPQQGDFWKTALGLGAVALIAIGIAAGG